MHDAGGQLWCPYFRDFTRNDLQRAEDLGLVIAVWSVNEFNDIDKMISLSVDAIMTDFPIMFKVPLKIGDIIGAHSHSRVYFQ